MNQGKRDKEENKTSPATPLHVDISLENPLLFHRRQTEITFELSRIKVAEG